MTLKENTPPEEARPFSVRCEFCGTVAESWHWSDGDHVPEGATVGMAYCACGNTGADSLGVPDKGRFVLKTQGDHHQ